MAFKLRSNNTGSIPLHKGGVGSFKKNPFSSIKTPLFAIDPVIDPVIDPIKKEKEKEKTASEYEEIGRNVTTRRGEQNGVAGTFTDTDITERMDWDDFIPSATQGPQTTDVPKYLESLKKRFPGVPGSELIERGFIGPEFADQFPLDYDQRSRLETSFDPDPEVPLENPYSSYDTGYAYNADFGGGGNLGYVGRTDDPAEALRIVERGENVSAGTNATVKGLGTSQQQGGTSGMVDADRNNFQSEQGFVVGIRNEGDYNDYDRFGLGRNQRDGVIMKDFISGRDALRQKYKGQENRTEFTKQLQKLKDLRDAKIAAAQSGRFYSPEMEQIFEDSHDTIYERRQPGGLFTRPEGGGRSGQIATPSETTINTNFLEQFLTEQAAKKGEEIRSRRR
jgi:hypothetical protein